MAPIMIVMRPNGILGLETKPVVQKVWERFIQILFNDFKTNFILNFEVVETLVTNERPSGALH